MERAAAGRGADDQRFALVELGAGELLDGVAVADQDGVAARQRRRAEQAADGGEVLAGVAGAERQQGN